jgi:uncharacterized protein YggE
MVEKKISSKEEMPQDASSCCVSGLCGEESLCANQSIFHTPCIKKAVGAVLVALTVFLIVQVVSGVKEYQHIGEMYNTIQVDGKGEVFAVPDVARFSATIEEEAMTVKEVQEKARAKADAFVSALKEAGVDEKDIKTVGYNVYPKEEWVSTCDQPVSTMAVSSSIARCSGRSEKKGFTLSEEIQVTVRDADKAGDLLGLATDKGVARVSALSFVVDNEEKVLTEAREKAIAHAKEKAEKLAKDLGVKLGDVVSYSEGGMYPYYDEMKSSRVTSLDSAGGAVVPVGENKTTVQVTVTYELR